MVAFFFVLQQPKSVKGRLLREVSNTRTRAVGLLCTSVRLVAGAVTYRTRSKHKRLTCMPSAGFESAVSATKQSQTYVLDRMANGSAAMAIGFLILERVIFVNLCLAALLNFHYHVLLRLTHQH